uniref:Ba1 globin, like n=1 Tax=Dicentrarchus labrax TaxID=13489 RepID=A0A8C4DPK7_DICLA
MVKWTDAERAAITSWWGKIDVNEIGPQALTRLLIVYPWTQRHFATFGNLSTSAAILGNPLVAEHGKTVMGGLDRAVKNMDDIKNVYTKLSVKHSEKIHVDPDNFRIFAQIKNVYTKLSVKHSEKIHVDPDNFRIFAQIISVCVAAKFGRQFTPDVQEAWQKFLDVVVSALSRQYH